MKLQIKAQDTRPNEKITVELHPDIVARLDQTKDLGPRNYVISQALDLMLPPLKNKRREHDTDPG